MALKEEVFVGTFGRDKGRRYLITEMPASQGERWASRAFLALVHSGVDVPPDIMQAGFAGFAVLTLRSLMGLRYEEAEPLLEEMMTCVQFLPSEGHRELARPLLETDIEEVATRVQLRKAIFELHVGFSVADAMRTSTLAAATSSQGSSTTPTSPEQSEPS